MKIAIIGAGPAGLVSLKYSLDAGHSCDVYEQTGALGGTWVYTDKIGTDEYGLPIHSSMYQGMRTNLPKEVMFFLDYPYPANQVKSYISQQEVLNYFNNYANKFNLQKHIKYYKCVTRVNPVQDKQWSVQFQDVKSKVQEVIIYDAVFVCNGHYSDPLFPKIPGQDLFRGMQQHSHHYRVPSPYKNKRVLVIGAGSSGTDIAVKISQLAEHVFLSYSNEPQIKFTTNLTGKPEVLRFTENCAFFNDGSGENVDAVLYCTGYLYSFPFLSRCCEISVEDNYIQPLYNHVVNIKHPTMFFIGVSSVVPIIPLCDLQVRFALAELKHKFLPSTEFMLKELEESMHVKKLRNIPQRHFFKIGSENLEAYCMELSKWPGVTPMPSVIRKLYTRAKKRRDLEDCFRIIDDENFVELDR